MTTPAKNPVAAAVGAAFLASVALAPLAQAAENPFQANSLSGGYTLAEKTTTEGKCGEGKCGEGKCGDGMKKAHEGKCGEGKCGESMKKTHEGKCGEGKCGGSKTAPSAETEGEAAGSATKP
ncbi:MAG: hypothetical protein AB7S51_04010 [Porticoccaceae bacterium]